VVDPAGPRITHLVVQPAGAHGLARLVPARLVSAAGSRDGEVCLTCSSQTVEDCQHVQEVARVGPGEQPGAATGSTVGVSDVLAMPAYDATGLDVSAALPDAYVWVAYDRVPEGEAEIRRVSRVTSADGHDVGHVEGFVVDDDLMVTHIVVRRGHLWRKRDVQVAMRDVAELHSDGVELGISHEAPALR
jgi:hypothetical protein